MSPFYHSGHSDIKAHSKNKDIFEGFCGKTFHILNNHLFASNSTAMLLGGRPGRQVYLKKLPISDMLSTSTPFLPKQF